MSNGYRSSSIAIDRQRAADARRGIAAQRERYVSSGFPIDGTTSIAALVDAGQPVGPDMLARARMFVDFWQDTPPHWRGNEDEWRRRRRLILSAEAA